MSASSASGIRAAPRRADQATRWWVGGTTTSARVVETVMADQLVAVVSQQLLDELAAVLVRPKFRRWLSVADAVAFVEALGGKADLPPQPETEAGQRSRDPADDYWRCFAAARRGP